MTDWPVPCYMVLLVPIESNNIFPFISWSNGQKIVTNLLQLVFFLKNILPLKVSEDNFGK